MAKIHALKKSKAEPHPPGSYTPVITPCRFKNPLSKWRVWRNEAKCIQCGACVEVCPYGVHTKAGKFIRKPKSYLWLMRKREEASSLLTASSAASRI